LKNFRKQKVWEKGHELTLAVYRATEKFPREELYGLTSQLRRACISIPANIAEGCGKDSDSDFARFLQIARGSASEVEYHLLLARDLGFLEEDEYKQLSYGISEVKQMLTSFIKKLKI
jgi:four helix bundle protein